MKNTLLLLAVLIHGVGLRAQSTSFLYQGQLQHSNSPANGEFDFVFTLHGAATGAAQVSPPVEHVGVPVTNGVFTTELDFGAAVFDGAIRFLDIAVRPNGGGAYTPLSPRQFIGASPYAIRALQAGSVTAGAIGNAQLRANSVGDENLQAGAVNSAKIANASVVRSLNGLTEHVQLQAGNNVTLTTNGNTLTISNSGGIGGGDILGSRLNIGGNHTLVGSLGATIAGGFGNTNLADGGVIGGGQQNSLATGAFNATIGGGGLNAIDADSWQGVIGGGLANRIHHNSIRSFIGGGTGHEIKTGANYGVIAGGNVNHIGAGSFVSTIGGGDGNIIESNATFATISGGAAHAIQPEVEHGTIGGGLANGLEMSAKASTVAGGRGNRVQNDSWFSTIGGGFRNAIQTNSTSSTIAGGQDNVIRTNAWYAAIAGGAANVIRDNSYNAAIGGGLFNEIGLDADYAAIPGGRNNTVVGRYGFAAGRRAKANHVGTFVWADSTDTDFASTAANQFAVRANGGVRFETGGAGITVDGQQLGSGEGAASQLLIGTGHTLSGAFSSIAGGRDNAINANANDANIGGGRRNSIATDGLSGTIGGGSDNSIGSSGWYATVSGGESNAIHDGALQAAIGGGRGNTIQASAQAATISGGFGNMVEINATRATIAGGSANVIRRDILTPTIGGGGANEIRSGADYATIAGGLLNRVEANADHSNISGGRDNIIAGGAVRAVIGGGHGNTISGGGSYATVPGGHANTAGGLYSLAAGRRAKANHAGAFVWADSTDADFASTGNNQFSVRAAGGVRFATTTGGNVGVELPAGATSWATLSDRGRKKDFTPADTAKLLDQIADLPVYRWRYEWEPDDAPPHLGPTAQDFKRTFYPGREDRSITTLEFDGVTLAAIQGLHEKIREKEERIQRLEAQMAELTKRLRSVQQLIGGAE